MEQQAEPYLSQKLKKDFEVSNNYYQNLLGYYPTQTKLQTTTFNKLNHKGIFLPRNQTAIIPDDLETTLLSLFHEYFGHGLFCEQSLTGRKLVNLERKLMKKEEQHFQGKRFILEDLKEFRKTNQTSQELKEFMKQNLAQYELFAIWTEYLLSGKFGINKIFERKYDKLHSQDREQIDKIINFNEEYGDLATFYASGLARRTILKRVKRLLEGVYDGKSVNNSKLILLTGSKKPFSDIDIFAVSNNLQEIKNSWLDVVVFNEEDFEKRVRLFEVQVTHPIIAGEFILGNEIYFKQKRKQLQEQPITEEAIQHNFRRFRENKEYANKKNVSMGEIETSISYSKTYLANALALREGKRIFTKEELLLYSQSENFIELRGGIIR